MERWREEWMEGEMDGWREGWMARWMEGRREGWMDAWMNPQNRRVYKMVVSLTPSGLHPAPVSYPLTSPAVLTLEPLPDAGNDVSFMGLEREEEDHTHWTPV